MSSIHAGDVGTKITLHLGEDLTLATLLEIHYRKPSGTLGKWTAIAEGESMSYITQAGDVDEPGLWTLNARVALPDWSGFSTQTTLSVARPILAP